MEEEIEEEEDRRERRRSKRRSVIMDDIKSKIYGKDSRQKMAK